MKNNNSSIRVVLILTHNCNLNCRYCTLKPENKELSDETLKIALDAISKIDRENIEIQFFGGEPLLKQDLIKKTVRYFKRKNKNITYLITTNGTLLNDSMIDFIRENNIKVSVSLDGDKITHDSNRCYIGSKKGSYNSIINLINKLRKSGLAFTSEMVITPETVINLDNNLRHLEELGCEGVFMMPVCGYEWPEKARRILEKELKKYAKYYLATNNKKMEILNLNNKCKFNTEFTIDYDGKVYSGNGFLINERIKEKIYLGDIRKDNINQLIEKRKPESFVAGIIFPNKIIDTFKKSGKVIEDFSNYILRSKMKNEKRGGKVSVQIPVVTNEPLKHCIQSVLNQTYQNFEIIVLVDGPPNSEIKKIKKNEKSFRYDKRIKFFYQENKGLGFIRKKLFNLAAKDAKYIVVLDHDDMLLPTALEEFNKAFIENKNASVVQPGLYKISESKFTSLADVRFPETFTRPRRRKYFQGATMTPTFLDTPYCINRAFLNMIKLKQYPETKYLGISIDLFLQLEELGPIIYIDKPLSLQLGRKGSQTSHPLFNARNINLCKKLIKDAAKRRKLKFSVDVDVMTLILR